MRHILLIEFAGRVSVVGLEEGANDAFDDVGTEETGKGLVFERMAAFISAGDLLPHLAATDLGSPHNADSPLQIQPQMEAVDQQDVGFCRIVVAGQQKYKGSTWEPFQSVTNRLFLDAILPLGPILAFWGISELHVCPDSDSICQYLHRDSRGLFGPQGKISATGGDLVQTRSRVSLPD